MLYNEQGAAYLLLLPSLRCLVEEVHLSVGGGGVDGGDCGVVPSQDEEIQLGGGSNRRKLGVGLVVACVPVGWLVSESFIVRGLGDLKQVVREHRVKAVWIEITLVGPELVGPVHRSTLP